MILLGVAQAVVAILVGAVLVTRKRRGWGWTLIGVGAAILGFALVGLFAFSSALSR